MRAGDFLRFRGPAGAEFVVQVGVAFDERTIRARIASGEWTPLDAAVPREQDPAEEGTAARPPQNAPKADWVDWAVAALDLDREDAEAMTKAQLIDAAGNDQADNQ